MAACPSMPAGTGPDQGVMGVREWAAATVSVDRTPIGACLAEPVHEFDPRPVRNNIGDAQRLLCCDDPA